MEPLVAGSVLLLFVVIRFVIPVTVMFGVAKLINHYFPAN